MFTLISVMKHSERLNNATCTNEVAGFTGRYWYCLCFLLLIPNVIRPVLLPHIRFNRDVMLAKDNTPVKRLEAHTLYCNKQTPTTPIACTNYGLKSEQARVGHIEAQWVHSHCNPISGSSRVLLIRCTILQQFLHRYIISCGTMYIAVIVTAGGHTMYGN